MKNSYFEEFKTAKKSAKIIWIQAQGGGDSLLVSDGGSDISCQVALKSVRQNLVWCGRREVCERRYVFITKKKSKSKALARGFCLFDS